MTMHTLYDSDSFSVTHMMAPAHDDADSQAAQSEGRPVLVRHGFEIVDKRSGKELYLDGSWAELFQRQLLAWQNNTPTQEELEETLEQYAELAHTTVAIH